MSSLPNKPLLRWIVGGTIPQGINILKESMTRMMNLYGQRFDYMVCHNNSAPEDLAFIGRVFPQVSLHEQDWMDCPISDEMTSSRMGDGTVRTNSATCVGSLWKLCPPRMRPDAHEIIMDNDIVMCRSMPQIDEFLLSDRPLLLKEYFRFLGAYDVLFEKDEKYNSGFVGLPPNFNYADKIRQVWNKNGSLCKLSYGDEQGLITYTLKRENPILIETDDIVQFLQYGIAYRVSGALCYHAHKFSDRDVGLHFTEANRKFPHLAWCQYKNECIKLI
jgi:hypothetical protein